uniref:CWH43-like N-terminal domain-containing protein n=1 Tax=Ascaris lumbricoides TaxID=6252 RepID=A0A0M3I143_ASCLU
MACMVTVIVPKTKAEREKIKEKYIEDNNDNLAYLNFQLLTSSSLFAIFSLLIILWAILLSYYFDIQRIHSNSINNWLNSTEWTQRACNITFADIPKHWLPSVLRIFELSVQGNVLFRIITIIPIALRLFHSYITQARNSLEKRCNNPIYWLCNIVAPYFLFVELISCALFSIITIRHDFPEFHRQAIIAFIISGTLHMLIQTITSLWRKKDQQKRIDHFSNGVKIISLVGFGFAAPQFLNFQQEFISSAVCHSYVPPFQAICEYITFICNGAFHLTTLIDNRYARLICYPRTASGECEPLKPANFKEGGSFEYCRSWELAQRQAQLKRNTIDDKI